MNAKLPPIPPENLSHKGPGETSHPDTHAEHGAQPHVPDESKQGQPGNTSINFTPRLKNQDR